MPLVGRWLVSYCRHAAVAFRVKPQFAAHFGHEIDVRFIVCSLRRWQQVGWWLGRSDDVDRIV